MKISLINLRHSRRVIMRSYVVIAALSVAWLASCGDPVKETGRDSGKPSVSEHHSGAAEVPSLSDEKAAHLPGLHNVVSYADGLYSGGVPEGGAGFDSLSGMGIKTIISVDGAQPDVESAKSRGMRYVHLPIGYNGMDQSRTLEIARTVKELPGPIYIHCHHGKHRSAGATGAAAVTLGFLTNDEATERMKLSGTSPSYVGLYRCVAVASVASNAEILAASNAYPERWKTTGLVRTMVEVDEVFEHLKAIREARWRAPKDHPDLVPAAEAGRLADLYRNLQDDERSREFPAEFMEWMLKASAEATMLEDELAGGSPSADSLDRQFEMIKASCADCHKKYRN